MTDSKTCRHDSGETSDSTRSGEGGRHSKPDVTKIDGFKVGSRHDDPRMHPDGWSSR